MTKRVWIFDDEIAYYPEDGRIVEIPYSYSLVRDGAMFFLRVPPEATAQDVSVVKRALRNEQDVVSINILRERERSNQWTLRAT